MGRFDSPKAGIAVNSIAFAVRDADALKLLRECATSKSKALTAANITQLAARCDEAAKKHHEAASRQMADTDPNARI